MFHDKPVIGLAGGIGAGKSFVAAMFGELGCLVLSADETVGHAYAEPAILQKLGEWWGKQAFTPKGDVDRAWIAQKIFSDPAERLKLEKLLHPRVQALRTEKMNQFANNASILAFIWDVPLLFEAGQNRECDAIIFVDSPMEQRIQRVRESRGWEEAELIRRENLQLPLDKKREMSDYVIVNAANAAETRRQVRDVLSQILQVSKS
jgi:dephospho-CoA kinase